MLLPIVKYGHPALRKKGARVDRVTAQVRQLVEDMLETMHAAAGVGLAAQQVGEALQLTVVDVTGVEDRPSSLEIGGQPVPVADHMPLVLINPELRPFGNPVAGAEGCLSFPEIFADIVRPESVDVVTLDGHGRRVEYRCGGLLARAIQHEYDHLQGILFIDRMSAATKQELRPQLHELQQATKAALKAEAPA
jgi:peptide deformylase